MNKWVSDHSVEIMWFVFLQGYFMSRQEEWNIPLVPKQWAYLHRWLWACSYFYAILLLIGYWLLWLMTSEIRWTARFQKWGRRQTYLMARLVALRQEVWLQQVTHRQPTISPTVLSLLSRASSSRLAASQKVYPKILLVKKVVFISANISLLICLWYGKAF